MKHNESELTESQLKDETQDGGNLFFASNMTNWLFVTSGDLQAGYRKHRVGIGPIWRADQVDKYLVSSDHHTWLILFQHQPIVEFSSSLGTFNSLRLAL